VIRGEEEIFWGKGRIKGGRNTNTAVSRKE
jgi:hypothetical protein